MSTHCNPLTNVTPKQRISKRIKNVFRTPNVFVRVGTATPEVDDHESRSFLEMSLRQIKKNFKI